MFIHFYTLGHQKFHFFTVIIKREHLMNYNISKWQVKL